MQDYIYYNKDGLEFPLNEEIKVITSLEGLENSTFLISNTDKLSCEFVAKEVDFYIKNSQDNLSKKIENVLKLYEIALSKYDLAQDISYSQEVSKELLVVINNEDEFKEFSRYAKEDDFNLFKVEENLIKTIEGHIGDLKVTVNSNDKDVVLNVSQILWFEAKQVGLNQSGTIDPNIVGIQNAVEELKNNINQFSYRKFTTYDKNICQYNERREVICGKCEEVCPTVAIVRDDKVKKLTFSQIDCHGCGGCISVCPSGALDYAPTSRESLFEMSKYYKDTHPLIVARNMDIENLEIALKENVFPFIIDGEKFLHEASLLTLLQLSGSQVIFYSDFISKGTGDAIRILNDIYQKKYQKDAILVAMNKEELEKALEEISFVENSYFNFNQENLRKREIFSHRLQKIVGNDDLGVVKTGEHIHYGKVKINQDTCTLCLVCVGACNVDALIAEPKDNTLRFNPSLCTACGYCEVSCPEADCLTIEQDIIELQPTWFKDNVLAQDELFACVECGVEFATKKAIDKIAKMMGPIFSVDPVKERTLYCCADCKPKIMMQSYFDQKMKGINSGK